MMWERVQRKDLNDSANNLDLNPPKILYIPSSFSP